MDLQYIKEIKCPVCGCNLIIEENIKQDKFSSDFKYSEHSSGGRWETRRFACGQKLEYCPNGSKTEVSKIYTCTNSKEYKLKIEKQNKALENIKDYIDKLDVDKEYKEHLKRYMY